MLPTGKLSPLRLKQELQEVLDCQQRLRRFSEEIILIMAESLARRGRAESEDVSRDAVIGRRGAGMWTDFMSIQTSCVADVCV